MNVLDLSRETLPDDIWISKYIAAEDFFQFYLYSDKPHLQFKNVQDWYDGAEGLLNELLVACNRKIEKASFAENPNSYLGSCWAICSADDRLFPNKPEEYAAAKEIIEFGSDAMWQAYCPNGGVRIRTTIGKLRQLLKEAGCDYLDGMVKYTTGKQSVGQQREGIAEGAHFIKRTPFRHENEYRFIITSKENKKLLFIPFNMLDLVDEFLISPNKICSQWDSERLKSAIEGHPEYKKSYWDYSIGKRETKPDVSISALYDKVSPAAKK